MLNLTRAKIQRYGVAVLTVGVSLLLMLLLDPWIFNACTVKKSSRELASDLVKSVNFAEFVNVIQEIGLFWAVVNQPPPGSMPPVSNVQQLRA